MKTFLHVGTHKTGTTLIQRFAAANRVELRKRGLWYPNYDFPGQPGHYTHHHFARAVAGEVSNQIRPDQLEAFVGRLAAETEQPGTLLLSSELAYRLAMKTGENVRLIEGAPKTAEETFWRRRGAYLTRLSRTLSPLNPEVVIVLRGQGDYARSLYQEQVKASRYTDSLQTFLKDYRSRFEYFRQIELLREFVGPVKILVYEESLRRRRFAGELLCRPRRRYSRYAQTYWQKPEFSGASHRIPAARELFEGERRRPSTHHSDNRKHVAPAPGLRCGCVHEELDHRPGICRLPCPI